MQNPRPRTRALPRQALTSLEIATLIAVVRLDGQRYGVAIHDDLEGFLGKPISTAAVYAALGRLGRWRGLRSTISAPLAVQGGRSKRLYALTGSGRILLEGERVEATRLWQALPSRWARGG